MDEEFTVAPDMIVLPDGGEDYDHIELDDPGIAALAEQMENGWSITEEAPAPATDSPPEAPAAHNEALEQQEPTAATERCFTTRRQIPRLRSTILKEVSAVVVGNGYTKTQLKGMKKAELSKLWHEHCSAATPDVTQQPAATPQQPQPAPAPQATGGAHPRATPAAERAALQMERLNLIAVGLAEQVVEATTDYTIEGTTAELSRPEARAQMVGIMAEIAANEDPSVIEAVSSPYLQYAAVLGIAVSSRLRPKEDNAAAESSGNE